MYWIWWLAICSAVLLGLVILITWLVPPKLDEYGEASSGIIFSAAVVVISAIMLIASIILGSVGEYRRSHDPKYWKNFYTMCQEVIASGTAITNVGMTSEIIEYNRWLVQARTDQEVLGTWSMWHDVDLSDLEYITLEDGTELEITFGDRG